MSSNNETTATRGRGRPQAFQRENALNLAITEFRNSGYEGATMDQLAEAMGISKPSIYRAFGDRKSLYRSAIKQYGENISQYWHAITNEIETIDEFVPRFLNAAIDWYLNNSGTNKGCLVLSTMSHAAVHADLMADLSEFITSMEDDIANHVAATYFGNKTAQSAARNVATLLTAHTHSLATRSRAGVSEEQLRSDAELMSKSILSIL